MNKDNNGNIDDYVIYITRRPVLCAASQTPPSPKDQYCYRKLGNSSTFDEELSCVSSLSVDDNDYDSDTGSIVQITSPIETRHDNQCHEIFGSHEQPITSGSRKRKVCFGEIMPTKKYCVKDTAKKEEEDFDKNIGNEIEDQHYCHRHTSLNENSPKQDCSATSIWGQTRYNKLNEMSFIDKNNDYDRTTQQHEVIKKYHKSENTRQGSFSYPRIPTFNSTSVLPLRSISDSYILPRNYPSLFYLYERNHMLDKHHHNSTCTTTAATTKVINPGNSVLLDSQRVRELMSPKSPKLLDPSYTALRNDQNLHINTFADVSVDGVVSMSSLSISSGLILERGYRRSVSEDIQYHVEKILSMPLKLMKSALVKKEVYTLKRKGGYLT